MKSNSRGIRVPEEDTTERNISSDRKWKNNYIKDEKAPTACLFKLCVPALKWNTTSYEYSTYVWVNKMNWLESKST